MNTDEFLAHFGVKGMRWGVINKDATTATSSSSKTQKDLTEKYKSVPETPVSKKQAARDLADAQKKFLAKAGIESEPKESGFKLTPGQKRAAKIATGALVVGGLLYLGHKTKFKPPAPGMPVDAATFSKAVQHSKMSSWPGKNYIKPSSYLTEGITLPKGHQFYRISTTAEKSWKINGGTYATHSIEDYNRYLTAFRAEKVGVKDFKKITFQAKEEIKAPSLVESLETLKGVMVSNSIFKDSDVGEKQVLNQYKAMTGGDWTSDIAKKFFKELENKGYSAIIDDMDAGVIGDSPLVIFKSAAFTAKESSLISNADIKAAAANLIELANRK